METIHSIAIRFLAGELDSDWTHAVLLGGGVLAEIAVAAGIVLESEWPTNWRKWLGIALVIGGVVVSAAFTISLFVFDEGISRGQKSTISSQQDKIAALEERITFRILTQDRQSKIDAAISRFSGVSFDAGVDGDADSRQLLAICFQFSKRPAGTEFPGREPARWPYMLRTKRSRFFRWMASG
jgi:hypothetical protein